MPLVRIDLQKGRDPSFRHGISEVIYKSMRSTIGVPEHDRFEIITEHTAENFVFDPAYLGIERTEALIIVQITLNAGRSVEQKKALYAAIAAGLHETLGVRPEDVFINLVEVAKENWSFGNGIAQYAT